MSAIDNPPAFPLGVPHMTEYQPEWGMSLRDWFAGKFLTGAATDNEPLFVRDGEDESDALRRHWAGVAEAAYVAADAMLAARAGAA